MSLARLWSAWNNFWFSQGSPVPIALFRIFIGSIVVAFCILFSPEAGTWFGRHAIVAPGTTAAWMHGAELSILSFFPPEDIWVYRLLALLAVSGFCLTLGIFSRLNAFICFILLLSFDSRNHFVLHTGDKIMCAMLLYLIFSRCGEALSLKRLIQVWLPKPDFGPTKDGSLFAQRLVQVQLAIVYWGAFTAKLHGKTWMDGTAVYYAAHLVQFQRFPVPYLLDNLLACRLFTWGTLVLECALCFLVWIKEFRYPLLLAGIIFHLGLDWVMVIPLFQPIMLSCYICFVDAEDLSRVMNAARRLTRKLTGEPLGAYYDGKTNLSCRLAETIRRMDIFQLVKLEDVNSSTETSLLADSVRGRSGIFLRADNADQCLSASGAIRRLSIRLPLLLPFHPLFYVPGTDALLKRIASRLETAYATGPFALS